MYKKTSVKILDDISGNFIDKDEPFKCGTVHFQANGSVWIHIYPVNDINKTTPELLPISVVDKYCEDYVLPVKKAKKTTKK